jgi:hypothetical protein
MGLYAIIYDLPDDELITSKGSIETTIIHDKISTPPSTRSWELNYCRNKKQLRLLGIRVQKEPTNNTVHGQQLDHEVDGDNRGRKNMSGMFPNYYPEGRSIIFLRYVVTTSKTVRCHNVGAYKWNQSRL